MLYGICKTAKAGELGFGEVFYERTSYASREKGKDFIGTTTALYGIVAGVYWRSWGPRASRSWVRESCSAWRSQEAARPSAGVRIRFDGPSYCDFTVNFDGCGKTVAGISRALLDHRIFGGKDRNSDFPQLGQSALYAVTEMRDQADLADALTKVCARVARC